MTDPAPRQRVRNIAHVHAGKDAASRESAGRRLAVMVMNFCPGKKLKVTVEVEHPTRSTLQNNALWGCAYRHLEEQSGNEADDLHEFFCGEFWGWQVYEVLGQKRKRPVRTTTTNEHGERDVIGTLLMKEFYAFIQRRAATCGFDVPDPDPLWFEKVPEAKAA